MQIILNVKFGRILSSYSNIISKVLICKTIVGLWFAVIILEIKLKKNLNQMAPRLSGNG